MIRYFGYSDLSSSQHSIIFSFVKRMCTEGYSSEEKLVFLQSFCHSNIVTFQFSVIGFKMITILLIWFFFFSEEY